MGGQNKCPKTGSVGTKAQCPGCNCSNTGNSGKK